MAGPGTAFARNLHMRRGPAGRTFGCTGPYANRLAELTLKVRR